MRVAAATEGDAGERKESSRRKKRQRGVAKERQKRAAEGRDGIGDRE